MKNIYKKYWEFRCGSPAVVRCSVDKRMHADYHALKKSQVRSGLIWDAKKEITTYLISSYLLNSIAGAGFEPATSGLWARRATRLLYPAIIYHYISKYLSFIKSAKTYL